MDLEIIHVIGEFISAGFMKPKLKRDEIIFGFLRKGDAAAGDLHLYAHAERTREDFVNQYAMLCGDGMLR